MGGTEELSEATDVVIMGAGIIGLLNALSLAKRGLRVTIVDDVVRQKRSFKVGESFLVSTGFARTVGELDDFLNEECFTKLGVWFTYGMEGKKEFDSPAEWVIAPLSEYTVSHPSDSHEDHYLYRMAEDKKWFRSLTVDMQICRPETEDVLLKVVRDHPGIDFKDSARITDPGISDGAFHTVSWADSVANTSGRLRARWVVDCSGRNRVLARSLDHVAEKRELVDGFQTTALWGQFSGLEEEMFEPLWRYQDPDGASSRRDLYTLHLWGEGYWIWIIRLSGQRVSVGVTYDQRCQPPGRTPRDKFWEIIRRYPVFDGVLSEETLLEFRSYRNVQYLTDTFIHPKRYAMVGDASSIIDAYYSQGIGQSCQTSWHLANIIERDLKEDRLDTRYIRRVNKSTYQDWLIIRNMVREKYTPAIADPRFFLLSHMLDLLVIWSNGTARTRWCHWLSATGGHSALEDRRTAASRKFCERRLFYSNAPIWGWLPVASVRRWQGRMQAGLAERARWRVEHGERVAGTYCQISLTRPFPRLWRALLAEPTRTVDVSSTDYVSPREIRLGKARESRPRLPIGTWRRFSLVLKLRTHALAMLIIAGYAVDAADTAVRRRRHRKRFASPEKAGAVRPE
ncbi:FAD-dependent monooxygenase [Streptosporangium sp. NPDC049644]|uniref:NAD(P)/FAD-dependent oxidoreductase n=1 Tax=Streptosporangium sp. NPDC049644 TaxID=3155507 RepID=UPI003432C5A8